jgi:hypothetical protein
VRRSRSWEPPRASMRILRILIRSVHCLCGMTVGVNREQTLLKLFLNLLMLRVRAWSIVSLLFARVPPPLAPTRCLRLLSVA